LLIDPCKMKAKENPSFNYSQAFDDGEIIGDSDILAEYLLVCGCWNVGLFADLVLRASGGNSLTCRYLRAACVLHGFLQELSGSTLVSAFPTVTGCSSSSENVITFRPRTPKVSTTSEAN
jgi:hypothetical protein